MSNNHSDLLSLPPPAVELLVQLSQLLQEARVWRDVPVGAHGFDGLRQRHALVDHQVGQDQGGRAAQTHGTVHEHFTCRSAQHKKLTVELLLCS